MMVPNGQEATEGPCNLEKNSWTMSNLTINMIYYFKPTVLSQQVLALIT